MGNGMGSILVVEDEEPVREAVVALLSHLGFSTVVASNGIEAVQLFDRHVGRLEAALVDIELPGIRGTDVCSYLRARAPGLPVVLMTGYRQVDLAFTGARFLMEKPFGLRSLAVVLSQLGLQPSGPERHAA